MSSLHLFSPSWLALLYPDIDGRLRLLMFLSTKIRRNRLEINDNRRKICKPPVLAYHKFGSMGSIIFSTAFVIAIKAGFRWPVMATPRSRRYSFNPAMDMSLKFLDPEALNILFLIHGRFTSSEGIYVPKNRLFVFVFILETLSYTAFRNCSDTFVCPKFRVGSHVVPPEDRVRKRSIGTKVRFLYSCHISVYLFIYFSYFV